MLTPAKIDEYSYNRVVKLYNDLNIDICKNIIDRIERMGDISKTSTDQIKILIELNSKEIFDEILLETSNLDDKTKEELQKLYIQMAKDDMQDYKPLYKYRDEEFKLSPKQIRIINRGVKQNNKVIRNFTKSIAYNGQKLYEDSVDKAYLKVSSGAMSYDKAIYDSYKEIASSGLKITDKAGRNINIDVAVRRSVLTGIQQTANDINIETGKILGCDGYETTVSRNARPSHALWQGKVFAITKENAKKYNVGLWDNIKDELNEPNCQHTAFPIILGVSKPVYTKQELEEINNKKVSLYGKEASLYEANQQMRYIERNIREYKREIKILGNKEHSKETALLKKWQQEYTKVSKETGIEKDYARTRV